MKSFDMNPDYDLTKARRGAVVSRPEKTRITIWIDNDILEAYRSHEEKTGKGYQTLVNETLRTAIGLGDRPVTEEALRRILREGLAHQ
ncbi:MAG: BrnA antitoxin family protein [Leptospirillum sp.]